MLSISLPWTNTDYLSNHFQFKLRFQFQFSCSHHWFKLKYVVHQLKQFIISTFKVRTNSPRDIGQTHVKEWKRHLRHRQFTFLLIKTKNKTKQESIKAKYLTAETPNILQSSKTKTNHYFRIWWKRKSVVQNKRFLWNNQIKRLFYLHSRHLKKQEIFRLSVYSLSSKCLILSGCHCPLRTKKNQSNCWSGCLLAQQNQQNMMVLIFCI